MAAAERTGATTMRRQLQAAVLIAVVVLTAALAKAQSTNGETQAAVSAEVQKPGRIYMVNANRWGYVRAMGFKVDGWTLKAGRRQYSFIEVSPGLHVIEWGKDRVPVKVETGKQYYFTLVEQALGWGGFALSRLAQEEGEFYLQDFKIDQKHTDEAAAESKRRGAASK